MKNLLLFLSLALLTITSCEKEELKLIDNEQIFEENTAKAGPQEECVFDDLKAQLHLFNICGVEYVFQPELLITNDGNVSRIQAAGKCYKNGQPGNFVDHAEIYVLVSGTAHIWCQLPLSIWEPGIYNTNLVDDLVPFFGHCEDCGVEVVNIDYSKKITKKPDDIIRAVFLIKMEGCGETYSESFVVTL